MRPEWEGRGLEELAADPTVDRDELLVEYEPSPEEMAVMGADMERRLRRDAGSDEAFLDGLQRLRVEHLREMSPVGLRALGWWFRQRAGVVGDVEAVTALLLAGEVVDQALAERMREWQR